MKTQTKLAVLTAVVLVALATLPSLFAQSRRPAADWRSLERAYAEANLTLAKSRLDLATSQKEQVADSVSDDTIKSLQAGVRFAQDRINQLSSGRSSSSTAPQIAAAEFELKGLQDEHAKSLEANKLAAGSVSDLQLKNEVAEINVAKARLAAVRAVGSQPFEVRMQWQVSQLQDQIRALWARPLIED